MQQEERWQHEHQLEAKAAGWHGPDRVAALEWRTVQQFTGNARSPLRRAAQRVRISEAASRKAEGSGVSVPARFTSGLWTSTVPETSGLPAVAETTLPGNWKKLSVVIWIRPPCPCSPSAFAVARRGH